MSSKPDNPCGSSSNLDAILNSAAYRRAEDDPDFIKGPASRPLRMAMEVLKPELVMRENGILSTIVLFGGTRILETEKAQQQVAAAEEALAEEPEDPARQLTLRRAKNILAKSHYYAEALKFSKMVSTFGQKEGFCDFVILTGGGPGIMEAGNRGACEAGAKSLGFNITLPYEQAPNAYITPGLCLQFHYFAMRKLNFLLRARAMVAFPGGFGTLDELFETLTLIQTKVMEPIPVILFGRKYWKKVLDFDFLVEEGTIDPEDLELFTYADTADEAWKAIWAFHGA